MFEMRAMFAASVTRVEIALSFLISSWVLVGPGLEFPLLEKTGGGPVSTRLVFLVQKKLIGDNLYSLFPLKFDLI